MRHANILQNPNALRCRERTYRYVKDFLYSRKVIIRMKDSATEPFLVGGRGTPQGAVLPLLLFNIALMGLPSFLDNIPGIRHGLYADDITIRTSAGSIGAMDGRLQEAADVVSKYAKSCGLCCTPQKSESLVFSSRKKHLPGIPTITLQLEGHSITLAKHINILGMTFQANTANSILINKLKTTTD